MNFKLSWEQFSRPSRSAFLFSLLMVSLLTGCLPKPKGSLDNLTANLAKQKHWQMKARVAIKTPDESIAATLDWQNAGEEFDFHLFGTFGITYAQLIQKPKQAVLKLPDDKIFYHQNAEQLLKQSLGWDFPIQALALWVKGLPSDQLGESISRDKEGQLIKASLNGWLVEFSRYRSYSGYQMPRIIKAVHPQLSLKIVVKDWDFLPDNDQIQH